MTKVEGVALSILNALSVFAGEPEAKWDDITDEGQEMGKLLARAAIKTMRYRDGPDEDEAIRISAGHAGLDAVCAIEVLNGWVDAALKDQEKAGG